VSFSAEPYGVFVDDLLTGLTGGIVREEFVFLPERMPFRLAAGSDAIAATVRLHGLAGGAYKRFQPGVDVAVGDDGSLVWKTKSGQPGVPAAGATWPDEGSRFNVSYESRTAPAPRLTDRNPGSITRTLAETFAREYAVLSRQLETVYRAAFLDTAEGRDLDQTAALVGVTRRTRLAAAGEVVFSRITPATGDIFIPAGTRVSTADSPAVTVETTEDAVLRSGSSSQSVPVRSLDEGAAGVAKAGTLTVIHRPILGIQAVTNGQDLAFSGDVEGDNALRRRAGRALETGGAATVDAIIGALTTVDGIREQDVLVAEDHVASPGVLKITIAADLDADRARDALEAINARRPAGIKVVHNLNVPPPAVVVPGGGGGMDPASTPPGSGVSDDVWYPIGISATVTPASAALTVAQKETLRTAVVDAFAAAVLDLGIGSPVIYNRLAAAAMAVDGVLDVSFDLYPYVEGGAKTGRRNLLPPAANRPRLDETVVVVRGALVALDLTIEVHRLGLALTADPAAALATIRENINSRLASFLASAPPIIDPASLIGALTATPTYAVDNLSYGAEFVDDGLEVVKLNLPLALADDQQPWIRALSVVEPTSST